MFCLLFQSVPSLLVFAISGAVDGAEATSNPCLFSHTSFALQGIGFRPSYNTVMTCFVVVVDSCNSVENVNKELSHYFEYTSRFHLREGECIITIVDGGDRSEEIAVALLRYGMLKKWYMEFLKQGEEWKIELVIHTIFDMVMRGMKSKLHEMFSQSGNLSSLEWSVGNLGGLFEY